MEINIYGKKVDKKAEAFKDSIHPLELVAEYEISNVRSEEATVYKEVLHERSVTEFNLDDGTVWVATNDELERLLKETT